MRRRSMDLNEEIAKVAYELFERDGREHGKDQEHWIEAEKIVRSRHAEQKRGTAKRGLGVSGSGKAAAKKSSTAKKREAPAGTGAKAAVGQPKKATRKTRVK
jgi:hypothetical protein